MEACRQRAVCSCNQKGVRNYASGYQHVERRPKLTPAGALTAADQESLVQFHSHQFQTLVGPTALLPELRTSVAVLSTAVMLFRRFYLSNSVLDFHPRKLAAACALFAAKVEEEKIEVSEPLRAAVMEPGI